MTVTGTHANETLVLEIYSMGGDVIYHGSFRSAGAETVKVIHRPTANTGIYYYRVFRGKNSKAASGRIVFQ
jgi:hypothetical protein